MWLASEVLGALGAGALLVLIARQLGVSIPRAFGAVALVPIVAAVLLAVPALWEGSRKLDEKRQEYSGLSSAEAQLKTGADIGVDIHFLEWAQSSFAPDETFHLEIGPHPEEERVQGVGLRQAAILQWGLFQLAPNLAFEQSPKARDLEPGEGRNADWIVFYEMDPAEYPVRLTEVMTYGPNFVIARTRHAG